MEQIKNNIKNWFRNLIEDITFFSIELIKTSPYIIAGILLGFLICFMLGEYSMYIAVILMGLLISPDIYTLINKSE